MIQSLFLSRVIYSLQLFENIKKYPAQMQKIKSHYRHRSQQNFILKKQKLDGIEERCKINKKQVFQIKTIDIPLERTQRITKISKIQTLGQPLSSRNSMGNLSTDRLNIVQSCNFKNELKKYNKIVQDLTIILSEISKKLSTQLYRNKLLVEISTLIKIQNQSQQKTSDHLLKLNHSLHQSALIQQQRCQIEKIRNQKNNNISLKKKLLEEIQNERKNRLLFEGYFHSVQKQIKNHQIIYSSLLIKSLQNKFLYMMTSSNDVVYNGHVLGLKKQSQKQDQKQLNKNTYMCLPTRKSNIKIQQDSTDSTRKISKSIGKKATVKKLVKIFKFVQSSKALQRSELSLYQQQDDLQRNTNRYYTSIHSRRQMDEVSLINGQQKNSILRKKNTKRNPRCNPRSGKILSIKFITDMDCYYEGNFDEIVYELFIVYQSLGINIFAKDQNKGQYQKNDRIKSEKNQDFFNFDQELLVNQSQRRINFVIKSLQKMKKFNDLLDRKIKLVEQNIIQTENYITELQKKALKEKQKEFYENQQPSIQQAETNKNIFQVITRLMNVDSKSFNSQQEIERMVETLLTAQRQTKNESIIKQQKQNNKSINQNDSSKSITSKDNFPQTFNSFTDVKKGNYIKSVTKTEGNQRKFHPLITSNEDENINNGGISCRSIFENGMKSLNNIFDNMKMCQSYQRAFEKEEFRNEYAKEITKKKRVMFRREAKVMPTLNQ